MFRGMGELLASPFTDCCQPSNCTSTATSGDCPQICIGDIGIYDTLAELKAAPASVFPTSAAKMFLLRGVIAKYDGGYRLYVSDPVNGDAGDDYATVEADNFTGRLKLLFG
jgi:hypothetical protein